MKNSRTLYVCQSCGYQTPKWLGRCSDCGQWNSLVEERTESPSQHGFVPAGCPPQTIAAISLDPQPRLKTGILEFDRILGGGLVPGSLVLIGGDPGIGKSTLVLQVASRLCRSGLKSLYVSGEESPQQIKLRAERISIHAGELFVLAATCIEDLFDRMETLQPRLLIVDSIQTIYTNTLPSAPGSVGQVREVSARLLTWAKRTSVPVFLVGHVTKEGAIAGPKVLEHIVDTVLYFEGERSHAFRILRAVKNRYGSTNEIGVFEMKDTGLEEVGNPSRIFLEERPEGASGSVVLPCLEGTRPLLVEIQALVGPSPLGMPRRTAIGVDHHRISLLVAVLGKRMGLEMGDQDIFVNVAGGLKVDEPGADLAIVSAMVSSFLDRAVDKDLVVFGEVGLAGEIRAVSQPEVRIKEAAKLGFRRCLLSRSNVSGPATSSGMELVGVESVKGLLDVLF
ncbi:MAG: DNA repair protein RadA [Deltaproteobacteria bacterium HGW-Deltaproteobacteria-15]|jgi:DNA repair protein RadA/Sms|nr:MAG: DNA repair protein RadA [Deltaproteobacteria bacterium HGW-Deltaproteobacteria-15]